LELVQVKPIRKVLVDLIAEAQTVVPAARESFVVKEQRGLPMLTPDLDLVLGDVPNAPGLYVATGCCMRGVQTAPGVGRLLAELIVHNKSWLDPSPWRVDRFGDRFKDVAVLREASIRALSAGFLESRSPKSH
jgi:glycine/D-amino acid oxidase-like deaminating enzyme